MDEAKRIERARPIEETMGVHHTVETADSAEHVVVYHEAVAAARRAGQKAQVVEWKDGVRGRVRWRSWVEGVPMQQGR